MSYYLITSFLVAVIAICYVWYMTRGINTIPDTTVLPLDTDTNNLLSDWYNRNAKPSLSFDVDEYTMASRLLASLYNIQVDSTLLVIGDNLPRQYNILARAPLSTDVSNTSVDTIYDIRSSTGVNTDICLVHNPTLRNKLRSNNTSASFIEIYPIADSGLETIARDYLNQVLKYRWEKITELNDDNVINNSGSFLYLRECNIPNIQTSATTIGCRINLLCSNLEFETLLTRWSRHLTHVNSLSLSQLDIKSCSF